MSSTSLLDSLQAYEGRTSFPFPPVDPPRPRSPSNESDNTPPYVSRSLPSEHSGNSSRQYHRERSERDSDSRKDRDSQSSSARILSRIASRTDRDIRHLRTLLSLTHDRLEAETRRADQAEQRVVDVLHRLKAANDATAIARADASRAEQELRMYQLYYEQARREIQRAQDDVEQIERARIEAEAEAARARDMARKCRERWVLSQAMEQGRQQGYMEGLERGRRMATAKSQPSSEATRHTPLQPVAPTMGVPPPGMFYAAANGDDDDDADEDDDDDHYEPRPPSAPVPSVHRMSPLPEPIPSRQPESIRIVPSRPPSSRPERVPDFAPIADSLPIPTVTTPANAPSIAHERPQPSPSPAPVLVPPPARSEDPIPIPPPTRSGDPVPIHIHEAPPSPSHPPYVEPPDNWIPYAKDNDVSSIEIPPPHEFQRPLTPVDPSPRQSEAPLPQVPDRSPLPVPIRPREVPRQERRYEPSVRSRDYAYNAPSTSYRPPPQSMMRSPQSKTSTRISEYDIVGPPQVFRQGVDREALSGRQQIYRDSPATASSRGRREQAPPPPPPERIYAGAGPSDSPHSSHRRRGSGSTDTRSTLQKLFGRKRSKSRQSHDDPPPHEVPTIEVESPSTDASPSSSHAGTAPHLLSPEHAHTALPSLAQILGPPEPPRMTPAPAPAPVVPETQEYVARAPSAQGSPARYAEAPNPNGVVYPDPPGRTRSRGASVTRPSTAQSGSTVDSQSLGGRRRQGSLADNLSGRLSPLSSIGIPFTSFAPPEGR